MNSSEALEHIERVVEVYADINPEISEAIAVLLSATLDARDISGVYSILRQLEQASTNFALSVVAEYPANLRKEILEKLICALQKARVLLEMEDINEIGSNQLQ